jgi:hypothetical protein
MNQIGLAASSHEELLQGVARPFLQNNVSPAYTHFLPVKGHLDPRRMISDLHQLLDSRVLGTPAWDAFRGALIHPAFWVPTMLECLKQHNWVGLVEEVRMFHASLGLLQSMISMNEVSNGGPSYTIRRWSWHNQLLLKCFKSLAHCTLGWSDILSINPFLKSIALDNTEELPLEYLEVMAKIHEFAWQSQLWQAGLNPLP